MTANEPDRLLMDADAWEVSGPPEPVRRAGIDGEGIGRRETLSRLQGNLDGLSEHLARFGRPSMTTCTGRMDITTSDDARREGTR